jgi:acid phosphatase type 7
MLRKLAGCVVVLAMLVAAPAAEARSVTIAAAGDIATSGPGDSLTAALIKVLDPDRVLTLGDNAYPDGTLRQFKEHYHPTWGAFKGKTHPALGNHDYHTEGAAGYFTYFGSRAPARNYTYVLGSWRVVSLDSARNRAATRAFLKRTLRSDSHRCELVYFHHPRWSSGEHGSDPSIDGIWDTAVAHGVDVVLNGHDHNYERFAKLGQGGRFRPDGTRQIVVGTGGAPLRDLDAPVRGSLERIKRWGVLRMTLRRASYRWSFRGVLNVKLDAGKTRCHR